MYFRGKGKVYEGEKHAYRPRVHVQFQQCAWADEERICKSHEEQFDPWAEEFLAGLPYVLFADNLSSQRKKFVKAVRKLFGQLCFGPAHLTHMWAPIDRGHVGSFLKTLARARFDDWLEQPSSHDPPEPNYVRWEAGETTARENVFW